MTLFSYEIFDAVARQGSFNKAAQQLHLTPSAISHAIVFMVWLSPMPTWMQISFSMSL